MFVAFRSDARTSVFGGRFDEYIHAAMAQEPVEFFDVIRRDNLSLETFLNADFAVVNGPLAVHYGMEGVHGQAFRRVPVSDPNRGSLITQAGYLAMTSEATRTSPVKRGIWILEHLFHRPPPPPPPNVGNLIEEDDPKVRPISEHLELHRENLACRLLATRKSIRGDSRWSGLTPSEPTANRTALSRRMRFIFRPGSRNR